MLILQQSSINCIQLHQIGYKEIVCVTLIHLDKKFQDCNMRNKIFSMVLQYLLDLHKSLICSDHFPRNKSTNCW